MSNKQSSESSGDKGILYNVIKYGTFILPPIGLFVLFMAATSCNVVESLVGAGLSMAAIVVVIAIAYYQKGGR